MSDKESVELAKEENTADESISNTDNSDLIPNENKGIVSEFFDFIVHNKAWWMTPIIIVLALMVAFIFFAESAPVLPFIYTVI